MPQTPTPPPTPGLEDDDTWPGNEDTRIYTTEDAPTFPDHIFDHLLTDVWNKPHTKG